MGSYFGKVPPVESLSQKSEIFASSLSQGSLQAVPADNFGGESPLTMRTGIFCESLLPLQCPVSLLRCSRCTAQSPPCQRGVPRQRRGGGIPRAGRFPHGFVLMGSACCESLSHASGVPAPFHKGAILRPVSVACPPLIPYSLKKGLPLRAALCFYSSALASAIIFAWLALGTSSYRSNFRVKEPLAWVMARRSMA